MFIRAAIIAVPAIWMLPVVAGESMPTIEVAAPYVRAVPPGQPNSAAFMQLSNEGDADRALVAAASSAADVVELHTHTMVDGMMQMRRIERIDLPAGQTVELAPGGLHVMLIGLTRALLPGETVELTLTLDDDSDVQVVAPVRPVGAMPMSHRHH